MCHCLLSYFQNKCNVFATGRKESFAEVVQLNTAFLKNVMLLFRDKY